MTKTKQLTPYKGVRDFYPEDMYIKNYIETTMKNVCNRFGYEEYDASILEPTELYRDKTSDEIVNEQTYSFTDRGGRDVTLRPEMTPTVARMVAAKRRELAYPARLFSNPNCFRYERPQKGRGREFWQLNVDIFGDATVNAEIEIISLTNQILLDLGATPDMYEFRINDRQALNIILEKYLSNTESTTEIMRILDAKAKMSTEEFILKLQVFFETNTENFIKDIENITSDYLITLKTQLSKIGITNVSIDPSIVRGFNYYTGIVFELYDTSGENSRSMFGGGRYDNLVSDMFGGDAIPTVGTGIGDMTMQDFLTTHNLLPEYIPNTAILVITTDTSTETITYANNIVQKLRDTKNNVSTYYTKKLDKGMKYANKLNIPSVIIIGENEVSKSTYTLKNMETGEQETIKKEDLLKTLQKELTNKE